MRLLLTRPAQEAGPWLAALAEAGHDAIALPLIVMRPPADAAPVHLAWGRWAEWRAVMFVSAEAVRQFFAQRPVGLTMPASPPRCWATGPGTRRALLHAGVPEAFIDSPPADAAQFDTDTLWPLVRAQVRAGDAFLIVRGREADVHSAATTYDATLDVPPEAPPQAGAATDAVRGDGRDWLGQQLRAAGAEVQWLAAYERHLPVWTDAQRALAQAAAHDGSIWMLSSSLTVRHLARLLPHTDWSSARAIVTHPRIAQAAQTLGFRQMTQARPVLAEVLALLESLA